MIPPDVKVQAPPMSLDGIHDPELFGSNGPGPTGGLVAGTVVLTADGAIPVEFLEPGDRIVTRNAGMARLCAVRVSQCRGAFVQIGAGLLGGSRPETVTVLPAGQTLLLRGDKAMRLTGQPSAMIAAGNLPAGPGITRFERIEMTVIHLIFADPHLVYADGLELLCLPDMQDSLAA